MELTHVPKDTKLLGANARTLYKGDGALNNNNNNNNNKNYHYYCNNNNPGSAWHIYAVRQRAPAMRTQSVGRMSIRTLGQQNLTRFTRSALALSCQTQSRHSARSERRQGTGGRELRQPRSWGMGR